MDWKAKVLKGNDDWSPRTGEALLGLRVNDRCDYVESERKKKNLNFLLNQNANQLRWALK